MAKIGRNTPCWCGSGKKYKRCHLNSLPHGLAEATRKRETELAAKVAIRESIQGKGRPIVTTKTKGNRFVSVGNRIYFSSAENTQTFVDFLAKYFDTILSTEWISREQGKSIKERHPLLEWRAKIIALRVAGKGEGGVYSLPPTGIVTAYYQLAYNLYLLDHNVEIQARLLAYLKQPDHFISTMYETHVAAWFILAGFKLILENETDSSTTHCEFTATSPSGNKYSVEAKSRKPGKEGLAIGNQLHKALKKRAEHPRIICIEMNVRQSELPDNQTYFDAITKRIKLKEDMDIQGKPAEPAYVFVSNIPFHLEPEAENISRSLIADGYKIDDFGTKRFTSLTACYKARQKHEDMSQLMAGFHNYKVPNTFDGEIPEFSFGQAERRFRIGERYQLDENLYGTLEQGLVIEAWKAACLTFRTDDGRNLIHQATLSSAELKAYRQHPDSFFGKLQTVNKECQDDMDLFEFFFKNYKDADRKVLLGHLKKHPQISKLKKLPKVELALAYAEALVHSMKNQAK